MCCLEDNKSQNRCILSMDDYHGIFVYHSIDDYNSIDVFLTYRIQDIDIKISIF